MAMFCPFLTVRPAANGSAGHRLTVPRSAAGDDDDDDELGMPLPDWRDPDWGFDDDETEPEQGDFWFDSNDEEDV